MAVHRQKRFPSNNATGPGDNRPSDRRPRDAGQFPIVIKTIGGLEQTLAGELSELGITGARVTDRAVLLRGGRRELYAANFALATALRVLRGISSFRAGDDAELYNGIRAIPWSSYFSVRDTFAIDCTAHSSTFRDSSYAARKAKDAVVDEFRQRFGKRPSVDTGHPDIRIDLHIHDHRCDVSLDSSGESLHRRGYRTSAGEAPLNEVLAAGMLRVAGWMRGEPSRILIDPFCGSGTIAIEAAMMRCGILPGSVRNANRIRYAFMSWPDYDDALWRGVMDDCARTAARGGRRGPRAANEGRAPNDGRVTSEGRAEPGTAAGGGAGVAIYASDSDARVIEAARANADRAGAGRAVSFAARDFRSPWHDMEQAKSRCNSPMIVTNPPYGERMKVADIGELYRSIGDFLKRDIGSGDAYILSANLSALKAVGLRSASRTPVMNGPIECRFVWYPLTPPHRAAKPQESARTQGAVSDVHGDGN